MTAAPVTSRPVSLTKDAVAVLTHFAAGRSIDLIALTTKLPREQVAQIVEKVANNDRMTARGLALEHQRINGVNGTVTPLPRPPDTLADMLDQAVRSGAPRLVRAADQIRRLAAQLETDLADHARTRTLREEAAKLEKRLAEIRRQLNPGRAASAAPKSPAGPNNAVMSTKAGRQAVRDWAVANGLDCPTRGRIPAAVRVAYMEAHR